MIIRRNVFSSAFQSVVASAGGLALGITIFLYLPGMSMTHDEMASFLRWFWFFDIPFLSLFCGIILILRDHPHDWYVEDNDLIKRKLKSGIELTRFHFSDIVSWRYRREIALIGQYWFLSVELPHIGPPLILKVGPLKIQRTINSRGTQFYRIGPLKKTERDNLIAAITSAKHDKNRS
jgi:hypothetical protein